MFLNKKIITTLIAFNLFTIPLTGYAQKTAEQPIKVDLYPDGKVFIQKKSDLKHKDTFNLLVLTYQTNNQLQQDIIQNDLPEQSKITSVFSETIDQKNYLFVTIKSHKINKKEKTDGYEYSVLTFIKDSHNKLQLAIIADQDDPNINNDTIGSDLHLGGFDGIFKGSKQTFTYKTPKSIREYLKLSVIHGPFNTDLYPDGKIYFQGRQNILTYPISFILEYNDNGKIKKEVIDQYEHHGSMETRPPEIVSVFTQRIQHKPYIFVIVKWNVEYISSDPRNGDEYQIYSYTKDQNGNLTQDEQMMQDPQLSGYDGTIIDSNNNDHDKDKDITEGFNLTDSVKLKQYLDQIYNFKITQGPFKTTLFPNGKIYFQAKESGYKTPINFVLEYNENGQIKKEIIDQYKSNAVAAEVASVFPYTINQKPYLFTIVKWSEKPDTSNGKYGYTYKVYGYVKNQNNKLSLDQNMSKDPKLTGFIGADEYNSKEKVTFHYETARKLKLYLKQKYNNMHSRN